MDEPTIPIRPLADTKPAAKPEPAPTPKAEAPQPKSQPAPAPKPQPAAPKIDPRIEPWLEPAAPKTDPGAFKPETAADAWLGLLAARGIEYLFANGGTDFAPVVEAYAKGQKLGW